MSIYRKKGTISVPGLCRRALLCLAFCLAVLLAPECALGDSAPVRAICILPSYTDMQEIDSQIESGLLSAASQSDQLQCSVYLYSDFSIQDTQDTIRVFDAMQGDFLILFGGASLADGAGSFADHGIKLLLIDNDVAELSGERIGFIGSDNSSAITQMAQRIRQKVQEPDLAIFITHFHQTTQERLDAIKEIAAQEENWTVSGVCELPDNSIYARAQVLQYLERHPEVNTLFCVDGYSTNVVCQAVEEQAEKYYLAGFDASTEVVSAIADSYDKGTDDALVVMQNYEKIGEETIHFIEDYLAGETQPIKLIDFNLIPDDEAGK